MKKAFITELDPDEYNLNIHSVNYRKGNFNIPQSIKIPPDDQHNNNIYKFILTDKNVEGMNNICLHIKIPEIKGVGAVCFSENFIFKLIKNFKLYINSTLIVQRNGFEFLSELKKNDRYNNIYTQIGNNKYFLDFKYGTNDDDIMFESKELMCPLMMIFDQYLQILKIPYLSKIIIELELNKITDVINYNMSFKNNIGKLSNIDLEPKLSFNLYNTKNEISYDRYIEQSEFKDGGDDKTENYSSSFKSITNIFWYVKSDLFLNNRFISYPGYDLSESGYINAFKNRLLEDLIVVARDESFKKIKKFSNKCDFQKINKKTNVYKFDKVDEVKFNILNVPDDHEIYFHTNILTFNRRHREDTYNISKKFKYILGQYIKNEDRILFLEVDHSLNISDVSIPISKWESNENTAMGDLRSQESKNKDIIINDLFIFGLDFLCKDIGYKSVTVRSGTSYDNIIDRSDNRQLLNHLAYKDMNYSLTELGKYLEPCIGFIKFNCNNIIYTEPSRFKSDETNNLRSCTINVDWSNYSDNNPKSLINKKLIVGVTHLKKLSYNDNNTLIMENCY
jgi:hypothetical protein